MSSLSRLMFWSLDYTCPMRPETQLKDPQEIAVRLGKVRALSRSEILDDICITATGFSTHDPASIWFPLDGFIIGETFSNIGGKKAVRESCLNCHANTARHTRQLAGCAGTIHFDPDIMNEEDDKRLQEIIASGMNDDYHRLFIPTNPVWYSFWIPSPLSAEQCQFLTVLFEKFLQDKNITQVRQKQPGLPTFVRKLRGVLSNALASGNRRPDFTNFMRAAQISIQHDIPLYVMMLPWGGSAGRGSHRYFDHCPRCKATTELPEYRMASDVTITCHVCGFEYARNTSRREWHREEEPSLIEQMGTDAWKEFARKYALRRRKHTAEQIEAALKFHLRE